MFCLFHLKVILNIRDIWELKSTQRNFLQLELYTNQIYGFYASPTWKGFFGYTLELVFITLILIREIQI